MYQRMLLIGSLFLSLVLAGGAVSAQQLWVEKERGTTFTGELTFVPIRADFPGDNVGRGYKKFLSIVTLSTTINAVEGWIIAAELPLHCSYETDDAADRIHFDVGGSSEPNEYGISGTTVGNPYLGFGYSEPGSDVFIEAGARIPVIPGDLSPHNAWALDLAALGDIDRPGTYDAEAVPVQGAVSWEPALGKTPHHLRVRGGLALASRTYSHIYAGADFSFDLVRLNLGYSLLAEHRGFDQDPELKSELGASFCMPIGAVRPGIAMRFPIDRERINHIDAAYNFYVTIVIPEHKKAGT